MGHKLYALAPMTGKAEWGVRASSGDQIMGIHSLSEESPIKIAGFT